MPKAQHWNDLNAVQGRFVFKVETVNTGPLVIDKGIAQDKSPNFSNLHQSLMLMSVKDIYNVYHYYITLLQTKTHLSFVYSFLV